MADGNLIPYIGLGTWGLEEGFQAQNIVKAALAVGYPMIDTASAYHNEDGVGRALAESGLNRNDYFITGKLWNSCQGLMLPSKALRTSLKILGLTYLDLYLVHFPVSGKTAETWTAMERLKEEGLTKSIGVSNFSESQLELLLTTAKEKPVVNQVEIHPLRRQVNLLSYCRRLGITVMAYSPLARGRLKKEIRLIQLAERLGRSPAQVILRWALEKDLIVIPKTIRPQRLSENISIFNFSLGPEDGLVLDKLNQEHSVLKPPFKFDFGGYVIP